MANNHETTESPGWTAEFLRDVEHCQLATRGRSAAPTVRRYLDAIRDEIDTLDDVIDDLSSSSEPFPDLAFYELIGDDDRMGLKAGDLLLCTPYDLDPNKVTVICRITDGFDPECNQYRSAVRPIPFAFGEGGFYDKVASARNAMFDAQATGDSTEIEYRYRNSLGTWVICTPDAAANLRSAGRPVQQRIIGGWA